MRYDIEKITVISFINKCIIRGWKFDPIVILIIGAHGTTHKSSIEALHKIYKIHIVLLEMLFIQILMSFNIILYKHCLEKNQSMVALYKSL